MKAALPSGISVELHVPDFEMVKAFYVQRLGFEVVWERRPEGAKGYLVVRLGSNVLSFWCGNLSVFEQSYFGRFPKDTLRGYAVEIVLMVDDIDSYFSTLEGSVDIVAPLRAQPWGIRDFRIADCFGFYLRFSEPHDITDPSFAVA